MSGFRLWLCLFLLSAALLVCPVAAQDTGALAQDTGAAAQDTVAQDADTKASGQETSGTADAGTSSPSSPAGGGTNSSSASPSPSPSPTPRPPSAWEPQGRASFYYGAGLTELADLSHQSSYERGGPFVFLALNASIFWKNKFRLAFVVTPLFDSQTDARVGVRGFVDPVLGATVHLSRRWTWTFAAGLSLGGEAARSVPTDWQFCGDEACPRRTTAAEGYVKTADIPTAAEPESPSLSTPSVGDDLPALPRPDTMVVHGSGATLASTYTMLGVYGSTQLSWRRTNRQRLLVGYNHSQYRLLSGDLQSNDTLAGRVDLVQELSPRTTFNTFGQAFHYLSDHGCTYYGTGVGLVQRLDRTITAEAEAAPEYGSPGCSHRLLFYYSGGLQARIGARTAFTASAGRDLGATYLFGSRAADIVTMSILQRTSRHTSLGLSGGYLHSVAEDQPGSSFWSYFVSPGFHWQIAQHWRWDVAYSHFETRSTNIGFGGPGTNSNWVYTMLSWRPRPLKL